MELIVRNFGKEFYSQVINSPVPFVLSFILPPHSAHRPRRNKPEWGSTLHVPCCSPAAIFNPLLPDCYSRFAPYPVHFLLDLLLTPSLAVTHSLVFELREMHPLHYERASLILFSPSE
ncbi:hypothetical protein Mapa_014495 [Marchantia paleacea]|nr:hypothetical protein Mapa_014495 [Marchantia paleacea]